MFGDSLHVYQTKKKEKKKEDSPSNCRVIGHPHFITLGLSSHRNVIDGRIERVHSRLP